jgi:hypothetical protein
MTTTELRHLAEKLNVNIGGMRKADAQQRIVEATIGARLNSAAIRDRSNFAGAAYLGGPGTPEAGRTLSLNATGSRPVRSANYDIEGPTKTQAVKMAQLRQRHLADAETARQRGDDDTAFNKDEQAFDLETDLRKFGYDVDTGKPTAAQRTAARVEVAKRRSFADSLRTPEQAQARQEARVVAAEGRTPGGRTTAAPVNHAEVALKLRIADSRPQAEAIIADLKRSDLEKIYEELRRSQPATPFNQGPLRGGTLAEARTNLVELAVGRNLDARAIERAGRTPGGKA